MFYISFIAEILALAAGLLFYFKMKPAVLRILVPLLLITVVNEGFTYFKIYANAGLNKTHFYIGFFFLEMICFFWVYYKLFSEERASRKLTTGVFLLTLALAIISVFVKGADKLNPFFLNAVCLCMIGFGFLYYRFVFQRKQIYFFRKDPMFWLSTGLIFVNFIHLLFVNAVFIESFRRNPSSADVFKVLNAIGNIFYYGCIIMAFICSSRFPRQAGT